jgi:hypothetical protein
LNGGVMISPACVLLRDRLVIETCVSRGVPVVMLLSGGYTAQSAVTVGDSINALLSDVLQPPVV